MVKNITEIPLDGGSLCLDFVNTVNDRKEEPMVDYLQTTEDLIAWARRMNLTSSIQKDLRNERNLFSEAKELRELLYRTFYGISFNQKVAKNDLDSLNAYFGRFLLRLSLTQHTDGHFEENWSSDEVETQILGPILQDARKLLLSEKLRRVKECPKCGWLFLDTTKNGRRKWCSMKTCGSSVKALEWYYRQKKTT